MIDCSLEERWAIRCDACGVKRGAWGKPWGSDVHIYPPDWTFTFCYECDKNQEACDAAINKALDEYWARRDKVNEQRL